MNEQNLADLLEGARDVLTRLPPAPYASGLLQHILSLSSAGGASAYDIRFLVGYAPPVTPLNQLAHEYDLWMRLNISASANEMLDGVNGK